jgi:hypothetical protein
MNKFLKNNFKYIFYITGIAAILILTQQCQENTRLHKDLIGKTEELELLNKNIANLERKYIEQKELKEKVEKEFGPTIKALRGRLKVLSNATYLIRERARKQNRSDIVYQGKRIKYVFNEIRFNDGPPVGYVLIFDDGRVVSKVYNHEIDVKTAIARDESNGRYDILSRANYILRADHLGSKDKLWTGIPYPLNITGGTAFIDPTESINQKKRFYIWAPNIGANLNTSSDGIAPGIGLSLMGYGYSKRDLDYKFLQVGIQKEEEDGVGITLAPVLYRPLPNLLPNTYIGPGYSKDKKGENLYFGINIGF